MYGTLSEPPIFLLAAVEDDCTIKRDKTWCTSYWSIHCFSTLLSSCLAWEISTYCSFNSVTAKQDKHHQLPKHFPSTLA